MSRFGGHLQGSRRAGAGGSHEEKGRPKGQVKDDKETINCTCI